MRSEADAPTATEPHCRAPSSRRLTFPGETAAENAMRSVAEPIEMQPDGPSGCHGPKRAASTAWAHSKKPHECTVSILNAAPSLRPAELDHPGPQLPIEPREGGVTARAVAAAMMGCWGACGIMGRGGLMVVVLAFGGGGGVRLVVMELVVGAHHRRGHAKDRVVQADIGRARQAEVAKVRDGETKSRPEHDGRAVDWVLQRDGLASQSDVEPQLARIAAEAD